MGEGSDECVKPKALGCGWKGREQHRTSLSCLVEGRGVFPKKNLLRFPGATRRPLTPGLGQGEELQHPPWHTPGGFSVPKPKAFGSFPTALLLGRGFGEAQQQKEPKAPL